MGRMVLRVAAVSNTLRIHRAVGCTSDRVLCTARLTAVIDDHIPILFCDEQLFRSGRVSPPKS